MSRLQIARLVLAGLLAAVGAFLCPVVFAMCVVANGGAR
jgi:hypothetical protein